MANIIQKKTEVSMGCIQNETSPTIALHCTVDGKRKRGCPKEIGKIKVNQHGRTRNKPRTM